MNRGIVLAFAIGAAMACTKKVGVIARDQTLISVGVPTEESTFISAEIDGGSKAHESVEASSFLIGSQFTLHGGTFDKCRTRREIEHHDKFGDESIDQAYDENWCNERPAAVVVTCSGAGCAVRDNHAANVTVVATGAGALAIDARVVGDDGRVRAEQRITYPVVVPDELHWYSTTAPDGPVDPSGCPDVIPSADNLPNGAALRYRGKSVRFPRPDTAQAPTAHACIARTEGDAAPTCWDVPLDTRGAFVVPAADVVRAGGHGTYEMRVEYGALTVRCSTAFR